MKQCSNACKQSIKKYDYILALHETFSYGAVKEGELINLVYTHTHTHTCIHTHTRACVCACVCVCVLIL